MTLDQRLVAALQNGAALTPDLLPGDDPGRAILPGESDTPAAVLVPITDRARPGVILTQRTSTMRRHAGQVAFPGGRIDPGEDAVTAALREAEEEIALARSHVRLIGPTDPYRTVTGYTVTPVIGVVPPDLPLIASEAEVAGIFEVPLDFLFDPANHHRATTQWEGRTRHYYEMIWQDRRIWGATAAMIVNLSRRLQWTG